MCMRDSSGSLFSQMHMGMDKDLQNLLWVLPSVGSNLVEELMQLSSDPTIRTRQYHRRRPRLLPGQCECN